MCTYCDVSMHEIWPKNFPQISHLWYFTSSSDVYLLWRFNAWNLAKNFSQISHLRFSYFFFFWCALLWRFNAWNLAKNFSQMSHSRFYSSSSDVYLLWHFNAWNLAKKFSQISQFKWLIWMMVPKLCPNNMWQRFKWLARMMVSKFCLNWGKKLREIDSSGLQEWWCRNSVQIGPKNYVKTIQVACKNGGGEILELLACWTWHILFFSWINLTWASEYIRQSNVLLQFLHLWLVLFVGELLREFCN